MPDSFPLAWPEGWKRTAPEFRRRARYGVTDSVALVELKDELRRFGATNVVISSNIALKSNGEMYANQAASIEDPGVAVYYSTSQWKDKVIACDQWTRVYHNAYAIAKTINALRAIDRAGATQILAQAFTAFGALPASAAAAPEQSWWDVLQIKEDAIKGGFVDLPMIEARYRSLAKTAHPDRNGGDDRAFKALGSALEQARRHFG